MHYVALARLGVGRKVARDTVERERERERERKREKEKGRRHTSGGAGRK